MPHLEVKVGPNRFQMEPCRLNDYLHPHEIDTEYFCGRVLVRIIDAPGAQPNEPGREYFTDRSRKFCIQIEGRFKHEWSGDDILFGSDFDMFVPFPRAPFNAGMRVARMIDPCTFYEEHPPSGRPYIMSPYAACMNVFCAWPAPDRIQDAVVVCHGHGHEVHENVGKPSLAIEHKNEGLVPIEHLDYRMIEKHESKNTGFFSSLTQIASGKDDRVTTNYWRFLGFRDDPEVQAYLASVGGLHMKYEAGPTPRPSMVAPQPVVASQGRFEGSSAATTHPPEQTNVVKPKPLRLWRGIDTKTLSALGSSNKRDGLGLSRLNRDRPTTPMLPPFMSSSLQPMEDTALKHPVPPPESASSPAPSSSSAADLGKGFERLALTDSPKPVKPSALDHQLGPWRFNDPGSDMVEDNAFIFKNESVSVPRRRKHFANEQNRKVFRYSPDVVYGASFFSNLMDFNTFDLSIGPVHINVNPYFRRMPIRYTLRSKQNEEIVFCTISFQLVE